jgi:hypothetical protein
MIDSEVLDLPPCRSKIPLPDFPSPARGFVSNRKYLIYL